jgi:hypothetical protein
LGWSAIPRDAYQLRFVSERHGHCPRSNDASVGIDRLVFDGLRAMTPAARLQLACEMTRAAAAMTLAGLRLR